MICFWERLSAAPSIRLSCGHVFHYHCCQNSLKNKWYGPRISFNFMTCPLCRKTIDHQLLKSLLTPFTALQAEIQEKALMRLDYEGMRNCPEITDPHSRFYNDATAFAMEKYAYFQCYKCQKSYFGGTAECQAAQASSDYDPTELHGAEYLQYKCRYCCSIAVFFCFGTTHFCARCHDHYGELAEAQLSKLPQCPTGSMGQRLPSCPLKVVHPPSGIEFPLGCSLCTYTKDF
ncbi:unnamed protein product [Soboliphyme baturini]|uniref:RCR-type E3 ubiquitin transferase n=1 Tax=Soboliphyme baturini TaxID=241478 RepID=A0A183J8L8_9BILA|nr:unnamed protein product [Soboliphyme baturini]